MALEIERKFLVINSLFKELAYRCEEIRQGYLNRLPERTVRVRTLDDNGFLTVKGKNKGAVRHEFEYDIPFEDACSMLKMCEPPLVEKSRYLVDYEGLTWEVDEYHGSREGLIVAEVELPSEDFEYKKPPFAGKEVTGDPSYYNSNL